MLAFNSWFGSEICIDPVRAALSLCHTSCPSSSGGVMQTSIRSICVITSPKGENSHGNQLDEVSNNWVWQRRKKSPSSVEDKTLSKWTRTEKWPDGMFRQCPPCSKFTSLLLTWAVWVLKRGHILKCDWDTTYKYCTGNSQSAALSFLETKTTCEPENLETQITPGNCLLLESLSSHAAVKC